MSRHVPGLPGQPGQPPTAGPYPAERLAGLIARQPLVLVVGPPGPGRTAALTVLAGPAAGGTMIDLGALWMAVDPPGDRPRTVRLNGAPSTVGRRGWEAIAGAIGAVAVPPAVVLVDTFQGLVAALTPAGAAQTITALVMPGRTVVVVLDDPAELREFGELAARHGVLVSVDGPSIRAVRPLADRANADSFPGGDGFPDGSAGRVDTGDLPPLDRAGEEPSPDRRWRWWRRDAADSTVPEHAGQATASPEVAVRVAVADATGAIVVQPLTPGGYYLIRLNMKAPEGSPERSEAGLGRWVEVGVVAEAVALPVGPHAMFVPRHGVAWACPCQPGGPHTCRPEERADALDLPFVAPRRPDVYRIHVVIRRRATVVHQVQLELPVAVEGPGPQSTVTYPL